MAATPKVVFRSEFRSFEAMFPANTFGTVSTEKPIRDNLNRIVLGPDNKPLMEQAPIRSVTFEDGGISLDEDNPYVALLRRHPHNMANGGADFFEVKRAAVSSLQLPTGEVTVRPPATGLNDQDRQRLADVDQWIARGIKPPDNVVKQAAETLAALLERFEVTGILMPTPERLNPRSLRARMTLLAEALELAGIWPPKESEVHERRGDASGSQAALA